MACRLIDITNPERPGKAYTVYGVSDSLWLEDLDADKVADCAELMGIVDPGTYRVLVVQIPEYTTTHAITRTVEFTLDYIQQPLIVTRAGVLWEGE